MHGMSSDISDICEFEFYEWVMFNGSQATFPETKFQVGRWLGPAIDVGSALTYKILKSNGRVVPALYHQTPDTRRVDKPGPHSHDKSFQRKYHTEDRRTCN